LGASWDWQCPGLRPFSTPREPAIAVFKPLGRGAMSFFLGSKMEDRAVLQSLERPWGAGPRPVSVGGESAPSSCPLRAPRGRDPCNQANVAWRASGLSRPLGALAARDPFIQAIHAGARTSSFLGSKMEDRAVPLSVGTPRGSAGVGNLTAATANGQTVSARMPRGVSLSTLSTPFDPW
jgi:hypothetical protein